VILIISWPIVDFSVLQGSASKLQFATSTLDIYGGGKEILSSLTTVLDPIRISRDKSTPTPGKRAQNNSVEDDFEKLMLHGTFIPISVFTAKTDIPSPAAAKFCPLKLTMSPPSVRDATLPDPEFRLNVPL